MIKHIKLIFFTCLEVLFYYEIEANYTIHLRVSSRNSSGSTSLNYIILTGHLRVSPSTPINRYPNGSVNPYLISDGAYLIISDKFPDDYGYINKVTVGNSGTTMIMQSLNIFDVVRNLWSNMTFIYPSGFIQAGSSTDFLYTVNGNWSNWSDWGSCSRTCGGGNMTRYRNCNNPPPANGGTSCSDVSTQWQECKNQMCPPVINGGWTSWTSWGSCSVTCGNGNISRQRFCTNPAPANGGLKCPDSDSQWKTCTNAACPINGGWSDWSDYGNCSVLCDNGTMSRQRICNNPVPQHNGAYCTGNNTDTTTCVNDPCPVNGGWSDWSDWGNCSVLCDNGTMSKQRICNNPVPQHNGAYCTGNNTDTTTCFNDPCPVNGGWSDWSDWGNCSVSCDSGTMSRQRICNNPAPQHNGAYCIDSDTDTTTCVNDPCPDNNTDHFVSFDLFNSTINDMQDQIYNLRRKIKMQNREMKLIIKQLSILLDWGKDVDSSLSDLQCLAKRCKKHHKKKRSSIRAVLINIIKIIKNEYDDDDKK